MDNFNLKKFLIENRINKESVEFNKIEDDNEFDDIPSIKMQIIDDGEENSPSVFFKMINASVGGKTTYWMLEQAVYRINTKVDYVFVYGGANDMYSSSITPKEAVDNIRGIARIATKHGAKCIIITGFDPIKCTRTPNPNYGRRYATFQDMLLTEYMEGAIVVDTRVVARTDCWDNLCHMAPSGHKKIASKVIKDLKFKKVK